LFSSLPPPSATAFLKKKKGLEQIPIKAINTSPSYTMVELCVSGDRAKVEEGGKNVNNFNPLSPNISMHFLLTVLHIFLMVLVERI